MVFPFLVGDAVFLQRQARRLMRAAKAESDQMARPLTMEEIEAEQTRRMDGKNVFKPGDVVRLKSGGPLMTVHSVSENGGVAYCHWFEGGRADRASWTAVMLELVDTDETRAARKEAADLALGALKDAVDATRKARPAWGDFPEYGQEKEAGTSVQEATIPVSDDLLNSLLVKRMREDDEKRRRFNAWQAVSVASSPQMANAVEGMIAACLPKA